MYTSTFIILSLRDLQCDFLSSVEGRMVTCKSVIFCFPYLMDGCPFDHYTKSQFVFSLVIVVLQICNADKIVKDILYRAR